MFGRENTDETVVHTLASAVRRDISFGVLAPDCKLKIDELRVRYGGSRHSLREMLRLLSAEGLVESVAQRGFRVTSATPQDVVDIQLVRSEIEKIALGRSLANGDVQWEARVVAAHHALHKLEEKVTQRIDTQVVMQWDEACRTFSASLAGACESPRFIDLQSKYFDQSRRFRVALLRQGELDLVQRREQQYALVDAVTSRNRKSALEVLEQYIASDFNSPVQ